MAQIFLRSSTVETTVAPLRRKKDDVRCGMYLIFLFSFAPLCNIILNCLEIKVLGEILQVTVSTSDLSSPHYTSFPENNVSGSRYWFLPSECTYLTLSLLI